MVRSYAAERRRARRNLRRIAKHASYTAAVICFFGAAAVCGESNYPDGVIVAVMAAFLVGMAVFGMIYSCS